MQIATEPTVQESTERNRAFHKLCLGDLRKKVAMEDYVASFSGKLQKLGR